MLRKRKPPEQVKPPEPCKHGTGLAFHCLDCALDELAKLREENQRLQSLLRKLLDAGDWYISALEFDLSVDGEDLEKEIRKQLEGE